MIRRFCIELISAIVLLSSIVLIPAQTIDAADSSRMKFDNMRQLPANSNISYTRQPSAVKIAPGFTVSSNPQQFQIGYIFDGSGKGWWSGNSLANITLTRNDPSRSLLFKTLVLATAGNQYVIELPLPGLSSFNVNFERIPVFQEESIRLACSTYLLHKGLPSYQATISIKGLAGSGAGSEKWHSIVESLPIVTSLQCQRVIEYAK